MGVLPSRILTHVATPLQYVEDDDAPEWIEGEPGPSGVTPTLGAAFVCVLFLPAPGGAASDAYRPRTVRTPTLMYNPTRDHAHGAAVADHSAIVVTAEMELLVDAPELAPWMGGTSPARWQATGDAQPFGPPGKVYGIQSTLQRVEN